MTGGVGVKAALFLLVTVFVFCVSGLPFGYFYDCAIFYWHVNWNLSGCFMPRPVSPHWTQAARLQCSQSGWLVTCFLGSYEVNFSVCYCFCCKQFSLRKSTSEETFKFPSVVPTSEAPSASAWSCMSG